MIFGGHMSAPLFFAGIPGDVPEQAAAVARKVEIGRKVAHLEISHEPCAPFVGYA